MSKQWNDLEGKISKSDLSTFNNGFFRRSLSDLLTDAMFSNAAFSVLSIGAMFSKVDFSDLSADAILSKAQPT